MTGNGVPGALVVVAVVMVVYVAFVLLFQRALLYFPERATLPPASSVIPGAVDARIRTEGGHELGAWFVHGDGSGIAVLVMNGNAGHRGYRASLARALASRGLAVLLYDHPGYGDSTGSPSEGALLDAARAAAAHLASREGVDPARLVYFGESLGNGPAVALAAERPPLALVLRSPFASVAEMARVHYPLLPLGPLVLDRYEVRKRIASVRTPTLVIAGERDSIVPFEQSRRVHDAAAGPKRLVVIAGADHNDRALLDGPELVEAIVVFARDAIR